MNVEFQHLILIIHKTLFSNEHLILILIHVNMPSFLLAFFSYILRDVRPHIPKGTVFLFILSLHRFFSHLIVVIVIGTHCLIIMIIVFLIGYIYTLHDIGLVINKLMGGAYR